MMAAEATHTVELDERWMETWVAFGFDAFGHLLARHMAYLDYCRRTGLADTEQGDDLDDLYEDYQPRSNCGSD